MVKTTIADEHRLNDIAADELRRKWPVLDTADLAVIHGSAEILAKIIARKGGIAEDEGLRQINHWLSER